MGHFKYYYQKRPSGPKLSSGDNGSVVKNSMDIGNGFNHFFVDIGQNLAKNIEPPSENVTVENFLEIVITKLYFYAVLRNQRLSKL